MRDVKEQIFMGNYQENSSSSKILKLQQSLHKGFSNLSGLQQGRCHQLQRDNVRKEIEDIVADIAMALTGKEIIFKDK